MEQPDLFQALDALGAVSFEGFAFRHTSPNRPATSGAGARQSGGRWNPPDSFPAIYTALSVETVVEEFYRLTEKSNLPPEFFLPRTLRLRAELKSVVDLRPEGALHSLGLDLSDIAGSDWAVSQRIGDAVHKLDHEGLLAPSATGLGDVLVIFEMKLRKPSTVEVDGSIVWDHLPDRLSR